MNRDAWIAQFVAQAPELTDEQRAKLAVLTRPVSRRNAA